MEKELYFDGIKVGEELPPLVKDPVTLVQLVRYAGASGDFNPLHFDPAVGQRAGFGGVIAQGMLIMGFVGQAVTQWVPNRCLKKIRVRFMGITRLGEVITITGQVKEKRDLDRTVVCAIEAKDEKGEVKIRGDLEAQLPIN
jgi:acyl dehydratase